jgi:hypothetical protein
MCARAALAAAGNTAQSNSSVHVGNFSPEQKKKTNGHE